MKKVLSLLLLATAFLSCKKEVDKNKLRFLVNEIPNYIPLDFKKDLIPDDMLIHKGLFSPNLEEYYYTLSDKNFEQFDIYVTKKHNGNWSEPSKAFFNSNYNDHGMSFSPDGNSIYFSSTRPIAIPGISSTWHIWKSDKVNGTWNEPVFIDIPNLRDKLISHPTIGNSGTLYFHSSNLDYSEMDIYHSKPINGKFRDAEKSAIAFNEENGKCTPYVSPEEDYIIFASIKNQLELNISFSDGKGGWINTKKLNNKINKIGQGNPYVTPDNQFLFFTTGEHLKGKWKIKWVNIESELKND